MQDREPCRIEVLAASDPAGSLLVDAIRVPTQDQQLISADKCAVATRAIDLLDRVIAAEQTFKTGGVIQTHEIQLLNSS